LIGVGRGRDAVANTDTDRLLSDFGFSFPSRWVVNRGWGAFYVRFSFAHATGDQTD